MTTKDYEGIQWQVKAHAQSHHQARKIPYFKIQVFLYSQTIREEKLFKYDNKLSWLMVSAILITVLIVKAFMLKEEVWCWSHSRIEGAMSGTPNGNFRENICSEDNLRSRIFDAFVVKFLACLLLLGFSKIYKMVQLPIFNGFWP